MDMFTIENRACYTRTYLIPAELAGANDVHVIAEVKDSNPYPQDGFYTLDLFLEAEGYGMRTYVGGYPFGAGQMRKEQIDLWWTATFRAGRRQPCAESFSAT